MRLISRLYPRLTRTEFVQVLKSTWVPTLIAGSYGVVHDQITYTIAPEYFTKLKFQQFAYADWGFPLRVMVAEVGFLATWWVGFLASWFLARQALAQGRSADLAVNLRRQILVMCLSAGVGGILGGGVGHWCAAHDATALWDDVIQDHRIADVSGFTVVACIHLGGYVGALCGFVAMLRNQKPGLSGDKPGLDQPR